MTHYCCPICTKCVCNKLEAFKCDGVCSRYFHLMCILMPKSILCLVQACPNISWKCGDCSVLPRLEAVEKLVHIGDDIGGLKNALQIFRTNRIQLKFTETPNCIKLQTICPIHYLPDYSDEIKNFFSNLHVWSFDIFGFAEATKGMAIKYLGCELFKRYDLINKFKIPPVVLVTFLSRIEEGCALNDNPYHNNVHAADVAQTMHYMLTETGFKLCLNDIEIFTCIIAAIVENYNHNGTSNEYHVMTQSPLAILYNDRSVLENHHISSVFSLMKEKSCNILVNMSRIEYQEFRKLLIKMILSTDKSMRLKLLETVKAELPNFNISTDKSNCLCLLLNAADISNCTKVWPICLRWAFQLMKEEFFQGDREFILGLPQTANCNRAEHNASKSEINYINKIVLPTFELLWTIFEKLTDIFKQKESSSLLTKHDLARPWKALAALNKTSWAEYTP